MRSDFAIFILSHGRAESQISLQTVLNLDYDGEWFIVIDDHDSQISKYQSRYEGHVIVFNKDDMYLRTQTMDNFRFMKVPTYARNFIMEESARMGYKYIMMLDDDIASICVRWLEGDGHIGSNNKPDINGIIESYVKVLESTDIKCLSFKNSGIMYAETLKKYGRTFNQAMLFNVHNPEFSFIGTMNEDFNTPAFYGSKGLMFIETPQVNVTSPARGSNGGGIEYEASNMYVNNFYSVMSSPSSARIKLRNGKLTLYKSEKFMCPKIIREATRKV